MSIRHIIERAGGYEAIASATAGSPRPIVPEAVRKWLQRGIPEIHWPIIMRLAGVSAGQILAANAVIRHRPPVGRPRRQRPRRRRAESRAVA